MTSTVSHHTPTAQTNDPTYDVSADAWNEDHDVSIAHGDLTGVTANQHHTQSHDHSAAGDGTALVPATLTLPAATSPAQTAEGSIVWDSDDDIITVGDSSSRKQFGKLGTTVGTTQAFGDAAAAGTSLEAARIDHKHAWPALGTTAAAIGTSAGGSATTPSKSDHVHATGAGTPSTQAMGDAAATGTGPAAAMTDHKHAMPARGYGLASDATPAVSLTTAEAFVTATTSISASTLADITGASVSLVAGTWLILATVVASMVTTTAGILVAAITDNANTVIAEASQGNPVGTATVAQNSTICLSAIVTPGSTTTYKLRAARGTTTYTSTYVVMDGASTNTANNTTDNSDKGTSIRAVRIA